MSDDRERARALWWLWVARGIGCGGIGLLVPGVFSPFAGEPREFVLFWVGGVGLVVLALLIGVPAGLRVKRVQEAGEEEGAVAVGKAAAGFALGCGVAVGTVLLLSWLLPSHLLPGYSMRQRGRWVVCLSNVRNIALAVQMYLEDNDDIFPSADSWCDLLGEYAKNEQVFQCPEARDLRCGFAYNRALAGVERGDIADAQATIAVFESDVGWNAAGDAAILTATPRHSQGDNYGCADGHGRWVKREDLVTGRAEIGWSVGP